MPHYQRVDDDKIKRLESLLDFPENEPLEEIKKSIALQFGLEIAKKLVEFVKVARLPSPIEGNIRYHAFIDVIVPETPKDHI